MNQPTISIIIPCYNSQEFIKATLESVLCQTYSDFELIIIDDGSRDRTREIIYSINDKRIRYFYIENSGMAAARNRGIRLSSGEYIAFLDHDDLWLTNKIELQLNEIKNRTDVGAVYAGYKIVNEKGDVLGKKMPQKKGRILEDLLIEGNIVGPPSCVLISREALNKVGDFNPSLSISADWHLWLKIARYYQITFVNEILVKYRTHTKNTHYNLNLCDRDSIAAIKCFFNDIPSNSAYMTLKKKSFANLYLVSARSYFKKKNCLPFIKTILILALYYPQFLIGFILRRIKKYDRDFSQKS